MSRQTLWTWIKRDRIKVMRLASGKYRIPESETVRMLLPRTNSE